MTSLQDGLAGPVKNASLMFMGAVVLILLIACTNVANLLIARTADRAAELSIRSALGASRARLARQLLTECLLLSFVATLAGLAIAYWTISLAVKVEPPPLGAAVLFNPGWKRPGFHADGFCDYRLGLRRLTSLYVGRIQRFRDPQLRSDPRLAAGSRKPGCRTGDAHDDSSRGSVSWDVRLST